MGCLLGFNFFLSVIGATLLITGITTPRWLVYFDEINGFVESERSVGIISSCQRLYRSADTDQYSTTNNQSYPSSIFDNAFVCYSRFHKWHNSSASGPDLLDYQKIIIGVSFACGLTSVIALFFTHCLKLNTSFHNLTFSKRIIECLLLINMLTVILALVTLALFLGYERLQKITAYGYSFWLFVIGTCFVFFNAITTAVYRIDVEFEYRRYRHESVATLC